MRIYGSLDDGMKLWNEVILDNVIDKVDDDFW